MSVATEITRLQTAKANLKTSIEAKGVTVSSSALISDYSALVDSIPSSAPPTRKDVNFYDYDGTLLYSYTIAQAQALQALPEPPNHSSEGLVNATWNWTLAEVTSETKHADIGPLFDTEDYKTWITIEVSNGEEFILGTKNGTTIEWGDESSTTTEASSNVTISKHVYTNGGRYIIKLSAGNLAPINGYKTSSYTENSYYYNGSSFSEQNKSIIKIFNGKRDIGTSALVTCAATDLLNLEIITLSPGNISPDAYYLSNCPKVKFIALSYNISGAYMFQNSNIKCSIVADGFDFNNNLTNASFFDNEFICSSHWGYAPNKKIDAFQYNPNIEYVDLSARNPSQIGSDEGLGFYNSSSLREVKLWDDAELSYVDFSNTKLEKISPFKYIYTTSSYNYIYFSSSFLSEGPQIDTSELRDASYMFTNCFRLVSVPTYDMSSVIRVNRTFYSCYLLSELPSFNFNKVTSFNLMCYYCRLLKSIGSWNTSDANTNDAYYGMFDYCTSLTTLGTNQVTNSEGNTVNSWIFKYSVSFEYSPLNLASIKHVMENLASGVSSQTFKLSGTSKGYLEAEPATDGISANLYEQLVAEAVTKGWTVTVNTNY